MRVMHVLKHTSNELHPFHKFGVGNRDTLQTTPKKEGINVVEEAKKFHSTCVHLHAARARSVCPTAAHTHPPRRYYSANLMRLTIMGTQSLDELEGWARGLFRKVPNKHLMSPTAEGNIRTIPVRKQEQMGNLYRVRSLEDQQNLVLQWVIPAQWPNYRSKPAELLTALLGHEGEHSLLSHLKEEGLATAISAGVSFEASDMAWVEVDLTLTDSGYANANAVILAVFHYVGVLQREGLPLWFFQEHKDMGAVNFRYQQRSDELDTVTSISERLQTIDPRFVLVAPYLYERYKPEEFDDLVQQLSPDRLIVVLLAADIKEADLPEQEPWYKTRYAVTPLPNDQLQRWIAVQSGNEPPPKGLAMPDRNSFIPQTFSLLHTPATPFPTAKPKSAPKRVRITPRQWLWHYPDSQYGQPRAVVGLLVATGADVSSPRQRVLLELYASCVRDGFAEAAYPASVAGLSYSLDPARNGLVIRMEGYDDAMPHFAEALGKHMEDFVADEAMVTRLQGQLRRDLSGFRSREPFRQLPRFLDLALSSPDTEPLSLIEATKKDVSVEELDDFAQSLWRASHTEVLVVGNLDRERAEAVADAFEQVQGAEEVNPKDAAVRVRTLHKNRTMAWRMPATTPAQSNSAVAAYFQAGTFSPALRARMQLLQTALREPAFKQLRTKEQLGYVVQVTHLPRHGAEAIAVVVQSDSSDPQYLDNRVELFLDNAGDHLRNMTKAEFKRRVSVLRRDLQMPFDSLTQLFDAWWSQVVEHTYEFNLAHKQDGVLATTKKSDLVKLFETAVHKSSTRRKLSLQIKAQKQDSYTTAQPSACPRLPPLPCLSPPLSLTHIADLALARRRVVQGLLGRQDGEPVVHHPQAGSTSIQPSRQRRPQKMTAVRGVSRKGGGVAPPQTRHASVRPTVSAA